MTRPTGPLPRIGPAAVLLVLAVLEWTALAFYLLSEVQS